MLSTARAIVLDDQYAEVQPVIRALARLGIGSVYLNGQEEDFPEEPLHGIRLAIVDMDLTGADLEAGHKADHTLGVLGRVLHDDVNPLMVIVWTGDDETYQSFREKFPTRFPQCAPGIVHRLDKTQFDLLNGTGADAAAKAFRDTVMEQLSGTRPLDVFWSWEQAVHDAASRTTSAVAAIIQEGVPANGQPDPSWEVRASHVLAALARASSGQQGTTPAKLLDDLCSGLEPLLLDRLEHHRVPQPEMVAESAQLIFDTADQQRTAIAAHGDYQKEFAATEAARQRLTSVDWNAVDFVHSKKGPEADPGKRRGKVTNLLKNPARPTVPIFSDMQAAQLNAMLHWSVVGGAAPVRPGNIYLIGAPGSAVAAFLTTLGLDVVQLRRDTFGSPSKGGSAVLVESTPACDYAQGKWTMPRFVAGFLAPSKDATGLPKGAEFLRSFGPLWYAPEDGEGSVTHLVLNSHFAPSIGMSEVEKWSPILMLRRRTLTDLQVWLSSQHMRQGLLNVT